MIRRLLSFTILMTLLVGACAAPAAPSTPAESPTQEAPPPQAAAPSVEGEFSEPCTPANATAELPSDKLRLVIGTGGTGGVYFPYGGGLARILTEKMENAEVTAEVTGGSVDNMKLIQVGDADLGMSTIDSAYLALMGDGPYKDTGAVVACTIAVLYPSFLHVVASEASGITTVAEMKGKRISVGSAGSSTEGAADRVLEEAGLNPQSDVTRDNLSVAESVAALKDQKIDAFFWIGGLPTSAVTDLVNTAGMKVKFIDTSSFVESMRQKYGPVYTAFSLSKDTYAGLEADVPGIGIGNILFVSAKANPDLVYQILETIFNNLDEVKAIHPEAEKLSLETSVTGSSIPFHPGAIKFYTDKGVWSK